MKNNDLFSLLMTSLYAESISPKSGEFLGDLSMPLYVAIPAGRDDPRHGTPQPIPLTIPFPSRA